MAILSLLHGSFCSYHYYFWPMAGPVTLPVVLLFARPTATKILTGLQYLWYFCIWYVPNPRATCIYLLHALYHLGGHTSRQFLTIYSANGTSTVLCIIDFWYWHIWYLLLCKQYQSLWYPCRSYHLCTLWAKTLACSTTQAHIQGTN